MRIRQIMLALCVQKNELVCYVYNENVPLIRIALYVGHLFVGCRKPQNSGLTGLRSVILTLIISIILKVYWKRSFIIFTDKKPPHQSNNIVLHYLSHSSLNGCQKYIFTRSRCVACRFQLFVFYVILHALVYY